MSKPTSLGHHCIVDFHDCDRGILDDAKQLEEYMIAAAKMAGVTILQVYFHQFAPQGISGTLIIAESHFNIHTWPEYGYAAADLFTCGDPSKINEAIEHLAQKIDCKRMEKQVLVRG